MSKEKVEATPPTEDGGEGVDGGETVEPTNDFLTEYSDPELVDIEYRDDPRFRNPGRRRSASQTRGR